MDSLIGTFHIDWKLVVAQVINFAIVFFVLYRFAIKPLGKVMSSRTETIKQGLEDAKKHAELKTEAESLYQEELSKARLDAQALIKEMKEEVAKEREDMLKKAFVDAEKILEDGRKILKEEKSHMIDEVEKEIARLVVVATEKVLKNVASAKVDEDLVITSIHESEK